MLPLGLPRSEGSDLKDGLEALRNERSKAGETLTKLMKGEEIVADAKNKQHEELADLAARLATYYFTEADVAKPGKINDLYIRFENDLLNIAKGKPNTKALAPMYGRRIVFRAKEVLDSSKIPLVQVNITRVLARLAEQGVGETTEDVVLRLSEGGGADLADVLLAAVGHKNEGVKYYALRGLRNLFALPKQATPLVPPEKVETCALALTDFIQRKNGFLGTPSRDELEGFRVLRREAIKALAQTHVPSLKDRKVLPALVLLKVVANDGIDPAPRIDERVEAAIGVARMRSEADKEYRPEYAAQQLGLFVVSFGNLYNNRSSEELKPWAIEAAQLSEALEAMKADSKSPYVAKVVDGGIKSVLRRIEAKVDRVDANDLANFEAMVKESKPSAAQLFNSVEGTTVLPPNRREAETPEQPEKPEKSDKTDKPDKPAKP
jgi:hypothetical protein